MFHAWGSIAYRFRRVIPVVIIGAIVALYAIFGLKLADKMSQEGWDDPHSQSTQAQLLEQEKFGRDTSGDVIVLLTSDAPGGAVSEPVKQQMTEQLNQLREKHPDAIQGMNSFFNRGPAAMARPDGTAAFASIGLKGVAEDVLINYRKIEPDLKALTPPAGTHIEIAGATAVSDALDDGMSRDIHNAEIYALPAVGVLLLVVFGGLIAAFMPLLVGALSILGSMGILAILASFTQINVFAQSVITLLGLGLAIDYGLFMVSRFREELAEGSDTKTAVRNTTATAGKTVVFSALMVAAALSGLLIFPQAFLKSVAFGAISAVGLAALLSVAVLPSIFAMLGPNVDKWAVRRGKTHRTREEVLASFWGRVPRFAMKHSKKLTFVIVIGLLALAAPIAGIKLGGINETYLPPTNDTRVAQENFSQQFPQFRTDPIKIVIDGNPQALGKVYQQANKIEGLTAPFQVQRPTKEGVTVLATGIKDRDDYRKVVNQLENIHADGARVLVAGTPAMEVESIDALFAKLPWMILYIVLLSFVLMALIFGSLIIPAKAVIMNILGTGATLGMLTLLFVDGVGENLFNFTAGPLMSPVLVLIIAIIFGLSTDYEVFLVSRMVEARERGETTDQAIRFGTATTGHIITAAALIMIVVCGAFGFSSIVMMKYIAFGMVIALILDATIIRMLLVPAVMHLLRDDNWWVPGWVKAISAKLGHNAPAPHAPYGPAEAGVGQRSLIAAPDPAALPQGPVPTNLPVMRPQLTVAELIQERNQALRDNPNSRDNHRERSPRERGRNVPFEELMKRFGEDNQ